MKDMTLDLASYAAQAWRRRWPALGIAAAICALGWLVIALLPYKYQASTRIYVDTQSLLSPLMKGMAVDFNLDQQVAIMQRTLLSRPNLESVMRATDLDLSADTPSRREAVLLSLLDNTAITAEGGRNLFKVSFEHQDPQLAKRVVQSLLTIFVESNLGANRRDMEQARSFIEEQIRLYEAKLKAAEDRLAKFKQDNLAFLPENGSYSTIVAQAHADLSRLREELADARTRAAALSQQLRTVPQFLAVETAPRVIVAGQSQPARHDLDLRIAEMQRRLDELRLVYTEQHPDMILTRRTLAALKEERRNAPAASDGGPLSEQVPNPLYEQLKLRLVDAETQVEMLVRRLANQERLVADVEERAKLAPDVEAAHVALNRDYNVIKENYERLLERRESARLSQEMDSRADKIIQFRIIEPPIVPLNPSGPNKVLFATLVLIAGLGAGALAAVGLAYQAEAFTSPRQLREAFDMPVLGSISAGVGALGRRGGRAATALFGVSMAAMLAAYGGLVLVFGGYLPRLVETVSASM